MKANWKIGAENFAGDSTTRPTPTPASWRSACSGEPKAQKRKDGALYWAGSGGGTTYKLPPGDLDERLRYVGYPDEMIARMRATWSTQQLRMVGDDGFMVSAATVFPNLSFVHNWPQGRRRRARGAVHLPPPVAAGQRRRDRGAVLVRRRPQRPGAVQGSCPTRPTSCASARRACSSRTTSRTGCRSRTRPRARWPGG